MVEKYNVRTDLALEERERFESDNIEVKGVELEESYDEEKEIRISKVIIRTEKGAKTMGKPVGTYLTLEAPNMVNPDEGYHREISVEISAFLKGLIDEHLPCHKEHNVLIIGLGNREVTPDALGPYVVDNLNITRHIIREYGKYASGTEHPSLVSAIVPGVMAQTGMETVEIVRGIVEETHPDLVIAVDALAARNSRRLNRTIQIADTGIRPGSGVGNHRHGLTRESVGVPVIAIGVPTVVDAVTIVNDTMENLVQAMESSKALKGVGNVLKSYSDAEKYELISELISPHLNGMFVTPKDIDEMVKQTSYMISEALNMLFQNVQEACIQK
ncbi:GPR endopeptidase [Hespellia stercorisuis]|uniref:Germination protease n=1 Tax=Hespellia stercorisuis DSM 15480 TaxID=1121950 RepID=A0A1M6HQZ2_9FIRM|nr:GPR endopeptidase [Hespellia stercorisuis]SHJ24576.1 spore protease [Hespellia stercorisuis DSM 15480]